MSDGDVVYALTSSLAFIYFFCFPSEQTLSNGEFSLCGQPYSSGYGLPQQLKSAPIYIIICVCCKMYFKIIRS